MEIEQFKSPMRVDLSGGFLDIWPVYALIQNCCVVNFSIPLFTSSYFKLNSNSYTDFKNKELGKIVIEITSLSGIYKKTFTHWNSIWKESAIELKLLQKHLEHWKKYLNNEINNIFIRLHSESPIGVGLGGSSSLCVSLAKSFLSLFKKQITKQELLIFCRDLETSLLYAPAGIQDYIPALESEPHFLYIIECTPFGIEWNRKKAPISFFLDHLLLIDTGRPHHSGDNNWEILKKVIETKDPYLLDGLNQLRDNALKVKDICEKENWEELSVYLNKEHELRGKYFSNWLSPSISNIIKLMRDNGAQAVKLCGAGGGGCLLVLAKNKEKKRNLKQICQRNNIPIIMNW